MKFSCEKSLLSSAIVTASRSAAAKSPIPALEGLLIEAGSSVKITGYDLKKGVYTSFPADVADPGSIILGARIFGEIVRNLPDGIVTVIADNGNMANITCADSAFSIMGAPSDDYPELPVVDYQSAVSLPQNILREMINETIFAVSDNESRPVYTGALFEIDNEELTVVTVDGYRLALRRERLDGNDSGSCSFIVPGTALSDLEKICADSDEPVKIVLGSKHISFSLGDTVVISRRLEGEFINYKKSIPTEFRTKVKASRQEFMRSVSRVSLIIDEKIKNPLKCTFAENALNLLCVTSMGRAEDVCSMDGDGEGLEIGFNSRYLMDALKAAPAEELEICLNSGNSPCIILPADGSQKFIYMILPVRLKAGD